MALQHTPAGARASALIYSLVQTARANGVDPGLWLTQVLREIPAAKTVEDFEALLPWNLHGFMSPGYGIRIPMARSRFTSFARRAGSPA